MTKYIRALESAMEAHNVVDVAGLQAAMGPEHMATVAAGLLGDARYHADQNSKAPRKVGSHLVLLDCLTCDKCIPVCPNGANFEFPLPEGTLTPGRVRWSDGVLELTEGPELTVAKRHQLGNVADACNECGQCDPWCPEDGGPYIVKPTLFISPLAWLDHPDQDGFHIEPKTRALLWRRGGEILRYVQEEGGTAVFHVEHGSLTLQQDVPVSSEGSGEVDLRDVVTMRLFLQSWTDPEVVTWLPLSR